MRLREGARARRRYAFGNIGDGSAAGASATTMRLPSPSPAPAHRQLAVHLKLEWIYDDGPQETSDTGTTPAVASPAIII